MKSLAEESLMLGIDWSIWSTVSSLLLMLNFFLLLYTTVIKEGAS